MDVLIVFLSKEFIINKNKHWERIHIKDFEKMKALSLFEENRAKIMSVFFDILHRLSRECAVQSVILPAIRYIESNYQGPRLSNAEFAKLLSTTVKTVNYGKERKLLYLKICIKGC